MRLFRSPWVLTLLALVLIALAAWVVYASPAFTARTVRVVGAQQVTDKQVVDAAQVPEGVPLLRLPAGEIAARVEQLDAVSSASVQRQWPDTVRIVVTERRPVAAVLTASGFGIVGSDGTVFRVERSRPDALPLLDTPTTSAPSSGTGSSIDPRDAAFHVAVALPDTLAKKVADITADAAAVQLTLRDGAVVEWGTTASSGRKAEVLGALLRHAAANYDVSVPDAPAWSG